MDYHWHDFVGNLGVAAIVVAYLALQMGWVEGRSLRYSAANAAGALLVLASLAVEFNLSAFLMEAFWLAISLVGVVRWLRGRAGAGP
ncbi:MAG TPA: hypothetical protein VLF66_10150 [Thermoanaerobaculia bacterium]|nr:hypothetical protein [Thermoanaerobaculia bacterium]